MKKILVTALLFGIAIVQPLLAADPEREQAQDEIIKQISDIAGFTSSSQILKIESKFNTILRIEKNGKETARFSLEGVHELVLIRCQGSGMGVAPRSKSLEEGMQIRVIAKRKDGYNVFSVSYTVPDETVRSIITEKASLPTLYSRRDMAGDDRKLLGNLILAVEEEKGEQAKPPNKP